MRRGSGRRRAQVLAILEERSATAHEVSAAIGDLSPANAGAVLRDLVRRDRIATCIAEPRNGRMGRQALRYALLKATP